jgi:5'-3' exonuclease
LNSKIFALIRQKKSLWRKFRRSLSIEDYESHRKLSNNLSKQIKLAKKGYEERITTSDYETANLFAHTFSHIYNHTLSQSKLPGHAVIPGRLITDVSFDRDSILSELQTIKPTSCPSPDN